jgi:hypothetical protein
VKNKKNKNGWEEVCVYAWIIILIASGIFMCYHAYKEQKLHAESYNVVETVNEDNNNIISHKEWDEQFGIDDYDMMDEYLKRLSKEENYNSWGYNGQHMLDRISANRKITFLVYIEQKNILNAPDIKNKLLELNRRFELSLRLWHKIKLLINDGDYESIEALTSWSELVTITGQRQILLNQLYNVDYKYKSNAEYEEEYNIR